MSIETTALKTLFARAYERVNKQSPPQFTVQFYPYVSMRHTIRSSHGVVRVRISDLLRPAPGEVLESILGLLISKLYGKRPPVNYQESYRQYLAAPEVRSAIDANRARRGHKRMLAPAGRSYNLESMFEQLNQEYFGGQLEAAMLGWSLGRARKRLGHFDAVHRAIVINRRLDHPLVPEYVVAFVLYHEMLHLHFGAQVSRSQRRYHHAAFRTAERMFPDYQRAQAFIDREL